MSEPVVLRPKIPTLLQCDEAELVSKVIKDFDLLRLGQVIGSDEDRPGRGWQTLARKLNVNPHGLVPETSDSNMGHVVLRKWAEDDGGTTVRALRAMLDDMQRIDVVQVLDTCLSATVHLLFYLTKPGGADRTEDDNLSGYFPESESLENCFRVAVRRKRAWALTQKGCKVTATLHRCRPEWNWKSPARDFQGREVLVTITVTTQHSSREVHSEPVHPPLPQDGASRNAFSCVLEDPDVFVFDYWVDDKNPVQATQSDIVSPTDDVTTHVLGDVTSLREDDLNSRHRHGVDCSMMSVETLREMTTADLMANVQNIDLRDDSSTA